VKLRDEAAGVSLRGSASRGIIICFSVISIFFSAEMVIDGLVWLVTVMVRFLRFCLRAARPSLVGDARPPSRSSAKQQNETKRGTGIESLLAKRFVRRMMVISSSESLVLALPSLPSLASHLWQCFLARVEPHYPGAHVGPSMSEPKRRSRRTV
jgi:hypothetical protein